MTSTVDPTRQVELSIEGMTCASCASRIERKLNQLDGVTATVNFATEKARVSFPESLAPRDLLSTVDVIVRASAAVPLPGRRTFPGPPAPGPPR